MSAILTQRWLVGRRRFLHEAGVSFALPVLNGMVPLLAMGAKVAAKPRRSVFIYVPKGVNVRTWQITSAGRDNQLSEPFKPLEKHRDNIMPIRGLRLRVAPSATSTASNQSKTCWLDGRTDRKAAEPYSNQ